MTMRPRARQDRWNAARRLLARLTGHLHAASIPSGTMALLSRRPMAWLCSHGARGGARLRQSADANSAGTRAGIHPVRFTALPDAADTAPAAFICQVALSRGR